MKVNSWFRIAHQLITHSEAPCRPSTTHLRVGSRLLPWTNKSLYDSERDTLVRHMLYAMAVECWLKGLLWQIRGTSGDREARAEALQQSPDDHVEQLIQEFALADELAYENLKKLSPRTHNLWGLASEVSESLGRAPKEDDAPESEKLLVLREFLAYLSICIELGRYPYVNKDTKARPLVYLDASNFDAAKKELNDIIASWHDLLG